MRARHKSNTSNQQNVEEIRTREGRGNLGKMAMNWQRGEPPRKAVNGHGHSGGANGGSTMDQQRSRSSALTAYLDSTILPPSPPLRRLLMQLDKDQLIQLALYWIQRDQTNPSPSVVPPQLSRRAPTLQRRKKIAYDSDDLEDDDDDDGPMQDNTAAFLDLQEARRARSTHELRALWQDSMADVKLHRRVAVDRILEVDWPQGLSYGMIAHVAFEHVRARRQPRDWMATCLDFDREVLHRSEALTLESFLQKKKKKKKHSDNASDTTAADAKAKLDHLTPAALRERFSKELSHLFSHALHLDVPVDRDNIDRAGTGISASEVAPLTDDWTKPFTHLRLVLCETPADVCSVGLHILHIPRTPWFLISGNLGRRGIEIKEQCLTHLAHSVEARQMQMPHENPWQKRQKNLEADFVVKGFGRISQSQVRGSDPLALCEILQKNQWVRDDVFRAGEIGGGKGRAMKRGDAEDGPLTRPEKRRREDKTGIYHDALEGDELDEQPSSMKERNDRAPVHPAVQRAEKRKADMDERKTKMEVQDLFGEAPAAGKKDKAEPDNGDDAEDDDDLPRVERIDYEVSVNNQSLLALSFAAADLFSFVASTTLSARRGLREGA